MKRIIAFGESLLDVIYGQDQQAAVIPGGSVLNTSVSLARSGIEVQLMTEYAPDGPGEVLRKFLLNEEINLDYSCIYPDGKTSLAFAVLDDQAKASYTFYKHLPEKRFDIALPDFDAASVFLFGSIASTSAELETVLNKLLANALAEDCIIFYDPNFRKAAWSVDSALKRRIERNFSAADIIRGSDEDFVNLFGSSNIHEVWKQLKPSRDQLLMITRGDQDVEVLSKHFHKKFPVNPTNVVSTIGAGDAFNAGFLSALARNGYSKSTGRILDEKLVGTCVQQGIRYASAVCSSRLNYIPPGL